MTVSERQRLQLYERLGEALGVEHAEVLMEYLPPIGWNDVARRHDIESLRSELHQGLNRQLMWVVSTNLACVGAVLGLIAFVD